MKSLSFLLRMTTSILLFSASISLSDAQQDARSFNHLKVFDFYEGWNHNVIDTAGNILFDEDWNLILRAGECEKFLGVKMLQDASRNHISSYDAVPAEFALLSPDGTKTVLEYNEIGSLNRGRIPVLTGDAWGIIDCDRNWLVKPVFENDPWLYEDHIIFREATVDTISGIENSFRDKLGLADYSGRILVPAEYSGIHALDWWNNPHFILQKDGRCSLVDLTGGEVIPPGDYQIYPSLSGESVWVIGETEKKVYYPAKDRWITENLEELTSGLYGCQSGFKIEFSEKGYDFATWVNGEGSIRLNALPAVVKLTFEHPYLRIRKDGKYGVVSKSGKTILPCIYDNIYQEDFPELYYSYFRQCVFEGILSVEFQGSWGLIDTSGHYLTHIIYDGLQGVSEGIVAAEVGGKTGFIDIHGNILVPFVFDWTDQPWENGVGTVYLVESPLLVNRQGEIIASSFGTDGPVSIMELKDREILTPLEEWLQYMHDENGESFDGVTWVNLMDAGLTSIPDLIGQFRDLEYLDLQHNFISGINYDLTEFSRLEHLDLSYNPLEEFPLRLLDIQTLSTLSLDETYLQQVPVKVFQHPKLAELWLSNNSIESLPEELPLNKGLEMIVLYNNMIKTIPPSIANLRGLEFLYLGHNRITELPPEIGQLKKLQYLDLQGNRLEKLPGDLSRLKSLHTIDLSNNNLTTIPESLLKLKKLKWMLIKGNPVSEEELDLIMELRPDLELEQK